MGTQYILDIQDDECIHKKKLYKEDFGPFSMIGELRTMRNENKKLEPDIVESLNAVSKGAISLFTEMKMKLDYNNNQIFFPTNNYSKSQKTMFSRYLIELKKADMVKRIKKIYLHRKTPKHMFMVNPRLVICNEHNEAKRVWELLC